jgi:hypothetical protein
MISVKVIHQMDTFYVYFLKKKIELRTVSNKDVFILLYLILLYLLDKYLRL